MNWISAELMGISLPDERYRGNLEAIAIELSKKYELSFSRALGERLRKSAWRLFTRGDLELLTTHQANSLERCKGQKVVLAVEDTTDVTYKHDSKSGLGILGGSKKGTKGLNIHTSMLLSEEGECFGIFYQDIWSPIPADKETHRRKLPIEQKESYKWFGALHNLNDLWASCGAEMVVKISDRESDIFELYQTDRVKGVELLIRVNHPKRRVLEDGKKINLDGIVKDNNLKGVGQVKLTRREKKNARIASVSYYSSKIVLPSTKTGSDSKVEMNIIWVKENSDDKDALDWALLTTLEVKSLEDIIRIVGYYTKRWVIERFHLILKSGLNIEKIQIDEAKRLINALQLYSLVGWHLLAVQKLGQQNKQEPATDYFEKESIEILEAVARKTIKTVSEFILTLASLVGFMPTKQQPFPGEKTLWIAISKFNQIKTGFLAAKNNYATG